LLSHPCPKDPLALVTDASDVAIGASLEQKCDGHWKPLGFFSRELTSTETRNSTYDRELLAIYTAIKFTQHMLDSRDFVIKTDHKPLIYEHTTTYHPASNGLIESWHRSIKAAPMCCRSMPWVDLLPTVLHGLRICFKIDIKVSSAELTYGMPLRILGELYANKNMAADPQIFVENFRHLVRQLHPTPTAHHIKPSMTILKYL
jgi:hypothetical protein